MDDFVPEARIEARAAQTLRAYRRETSRRIEPPVDVDLVAELLFGFRWDYERLDDDETLAALHARDRIVKLNETHADLFGRKPGLERYTKAHEAGHWMLHVDQAVMGLGTLSGLSQEERILCRSGNSKARIETQADLFAAHLLMPEDLFVSAARQHDLQSWASLYDLADTFDVTISALKIRLERLDLIHVDESGQIHRSEAERHGQRSLF